jgi:putative ABC transport system ATP-binding protein
MKRNPPLTHFKAPASLIRLSQVRKEYQTPNGPFCGLKETDFEIYAGEFVAVIGKSGAGKTTLVNMITGVDHATSGEVVVGGAYLHEMDETQLSQWRGRNMGVIYQAFHLLPGLSLLDNVLLPMDFCNRYRGRQSREHAMELLRQVGLEGHARKQLRNLRRTAATRGDRPCAGKRPRHTGGR